MVEDDSITEMNTIFPIQSNASDCSENVMLLLRGSLYSYYLQLNIPI